MAKKKGNRNKKNNTKSLTKTEKEVITEESSNFTEEMTNFTEDNSEKSATFKEESNTITMDTFTSSEETIVDVEKTNSAEIEEIPIGVDKSTVTEIKENTIQTEKLKIQKKVLKGTDTFIKQFRLTDTRVSLYSILVVFTIFSMVSMGIYALYSFIYEIPTEVVAENLNFEPITNEAEYYVDVANDEVSTENIVWASDFKETLNNSLDSLTHMYLKQTTSSVNKKGNLANVALTTELETDFANDRLYCKTEYADDIGTKENEYFYDLTENLYLTKQLDTENWLKSQQVAVNVNFDIAEYNNCAEFYSYLLNDFKILNNTEGTVIEDYIYFDYTRAAVSRDLTNINFDTLGDTNIQLIFKKVSNTEIYPISLIKSVGFTKNDNTYISKIAIQLDGLNKDPLEIPEYRTYIEEPYESDDSDIIEEDEG